MSFLKVIPSVAAPSSPVGDVLRGVGPKRAAKLKGAGVVTLEDVGKLDEKEAAALGIGAKTPSKVSAFLAEKELSSALDALAIGESW